MSDSDLTHLTKDADHFGVNVARTIRVISKLLLDWSLAERARKDTRGMADGAEIGDKSNRPLPYLRAIYFDKLAMFYCRLWNRLNEDGHVRYRAAFSQNRGFHGPGQALKINRTEDEKIGMGKNPYDNRRSQFAFTTEIVEKLKPGIGNARILFRLEGDPWSAECKVNPELEENVWDSWCFASETDKDEALFLNRRELTLTSSISQAIASLSRAELRAIGTHCSASETCKDIKFNLENWKIAFDHVIIGLERNDSQDVESYSLRLVTLSQEVRRKSLDNRKDYESAFKKFTTSVTAVPALLNSFKAVQKEGDQIWQNPSVSEYANIAPVFLSLSLYCRRILNITGRIVRIDKREVQESDECLIDLKSWCAQKNFTLIDYQQAKSKSEPEITLMLKSLKEKVLLQMPNEDFGEASK
jgi:hypothetical protein